MIGKTKFVEENGVSFCLKEYRYYTVIVDIDVEPGVKKVCFPNDTNTRNIVLDSVMKQFPDVEILVVGNGYVNIDISNFMFPNVKKVISHNKNYVSGDMLIKQNSQRKMLCNAFCNPSRDTLDLEGVTYIKSHALAGTYFRNFINCESLDANRCTGILRGSLIQLNPSLFMVDDKVVVGHALLMINDESKCICITDDIHSICTDVFENVNMVSISSMEQLDKLPFLMNTVKTLLCDTDERINFNHLSLTANNLENIMISSKNPYYSTYNDMVYNKDKSRLIFCPVNKKDNFGIYDGTREIMNGAFQYCKNISSISIPDSVTFIGHMAFHLCSSLESLSLGQGIERIGESAFSGCSIKNINIPGCVKTICREAFLCNGKMTVTLQDGIQEIGDRAFRQCEINELHIPKSIKYIGRNAFPRCIHEIYVPEEYPKDILLSLVGINLESDNICCIHIENYGEIYIPTDLSGDLAAFLNCQFNLHNLDKAFTDTLYQYAHSIPCKQNIAILAYDKSKNEDVGKYLRRSGKAIVKRLISENDDSTLIKFVKTGLLTDKTLKYALDEANKYQMTTVSSYILDEMDKSENTASPSFRL